MPEGEGVKDDLINYHITKKPLKVLGHGNIRGIDLDYYNPELHEIQEKATPIRKNGIFTFIFIGRLVGDKGINELVDAFVKLNSQYPDTRLLLVGPEEQNLDPLKPETLDLIHSNNAIEAVGSQSDVRPWLVASEVFVFPSYREGFPNVVIEAGAMGLPSIVTDINGSREIIMEGMNGTIVPSHNADTLCDAMKKLMQDSNLRTKMSKQARPLIASRYEQGYVRECIRNYYKEIMK